MRRPKIPLFSCFFKFCGFSQDLSFIDIFVSIHYWYVPRVGRGAFKQSLKRFEKALSKQEAKTFIWRSSFRTISSVMNKKETRIIFRRSTARIQQATIPNLTWKKLVRKLIFNNFSFQKDILPPYFLIGFSPSSIIKFHTPCHDSAVFAPLSTLIPSSFNRQ